VKIMSFAISTSCTTLPLTLVKSRRRDAVALYCSVLTSSGPIGANLSNAFAKMNCPPELPWS
jgi:hypothetical protein